MSPLKELDRIVKVYEQCVSYKDTGTVHRQLNGTAYAADSISFSTSFDRGRKLEFLGNAPARQNEIYYPTEVAFSALSAKWWKLTSDGDSAHLDAEMFSSQKVELHDVTLDSAFENLELASCGCAGLILPIICERLSRRSTVLSYLDECEQVDECVKGEFCEITGSSSAKHSGLKVLLDRQKSVLKSVTKRFLIKEKHDTEILQKSIAALEQAGLTEEVKTAELALSWFKKPKNAVLEVSYTFDSVEIAS
jgi:hypothetical protein